ncbi:DUF4064 domain-containing protein [Staphylococcus saccharolyticus]|uniref:Membrane protein n=1 Tax=Staphylococcus saccharolyticus TaxID=33028 RepID=A0A380H721_9STAP|nr:DUF4064 domain-containing protein [Staphylococcus saccharolyticus]MBL7565526.1 DUF4064 domain-containing protein [Staphylococcus saccharolyticus]MBL7571417.1 DUF4064 domain-containing protein [Staphylococcus saccharolyticus]QQB97936.1 DUF4064 domain-containing protein [Staphylococcus saccharolyticus]QRJ66209.1 DUF4064 domain-containing protein [Staphylococcus saccharolyticus]RTY00315.1 DUF4064 domain-containing protein [Staphylococcus saccharolyticus]
MNKKVEISLAWVANGLSFLYLLITSISLLFMNNDSYQQQYNDMLKQFTGAQQNLSSEVVYLSIVLSIGILAFSTILGVFGALTIKGRKNLAGGLLIAAAIIGFFTSNIIAAILWIIAAIKLFSKKEPSQKDNLHQQYNETNKRTTNDYKQPRQNDEKWDPDKELRNRKKDDPYIY